MAPNDTSALEQSLNVPFRRLYVYLLKVAEAIKEGFFAAMEII